MTLILSMASPDLVTVVPIGTSPGPHVSGPTWASPGPGVSHTHLGSIRIWLHCSPTVTRPDLLTLVFTWSTLGHGDTGSHLGLTRTWLVGSPPGPHLSPLILVPTWNHVDLVAAVFLASHVPRDYGPHQGLTGTW